MPRTRLPFVVFLLLSCGMAARAEERRAVIERAVKAMGLDRDPARRPALRMTVRFSGWWQGTGHLYYQSPQKRRLDLILDRAPDGRPSSRTWTVDGNKFWADLDGKVVEGRREEAYGSSEPLGFLFLDGLVLPFFFADKEATLEVVEEGWSSGQPYSPIVRASYKKGPSYYLGFDRKNGTVAVGGVATEDRGTPPEMMFGGSRELSQDNGAAKLKAEGIDPTDLVTFLRQYAAEPALLYRARTLVRRLGDERFEVREKAAAALLNLDVAAVAALRPALRDPDPEIVRQACACLEKLESDLGDALFSAAIRQVVARRPKGAIPALLALLPGASEATTREVMAALVVLSRDGETPDPWLLSALNDTEPVIRAAAAAVLGRDGGEYLKLPGRRLYQPGVKLLTTGTILFPRGHISCEVTGIEFFNAFDPKLFAKP